jgi:hypothetical protein
MFPLFTKHPASVGETYFEHLGSAGGFGSRMIIAGLACLVHGIFPFLFQRTGSTTISTLYQRMVVGRNKQDSQKGDVTTRCAASQGRRL